MEECQKEDGNIVIYMYNGNFRELQTATQFLMELKNRNQHLKMCLVDRRTEQDCFTTEFSKGRKPEMKEYLGEQL